MVKQLTPDMSVLALDVGDARIGVARANPLAKIPEPLRAISNNEGVLDEIQSVIDQHNAGMLVVGLPRNMKGEETAQSQKIREFAKRLEITGKDIVFVDESLSSKRADSYLTENKKSGADQDSIAACFILDEFFNTIGGVL